MNPATIHVVDDDAGVRDSMKFLLDAEGQRTVTYDSARALLDADIAPAGCVVTDFHMPDLDGLQLQERLAERAPLLPVIVMTGHADVPAAVRAMKAGAVDFLEKPFSDGQLLAAVRVALERNQVALEAAGRATAAAALIGLLTAREYEVLDLMVLGQSNKAIARSLGTSPRTVEVHRARVFEKLNVDSLPDLVRLAQAGRPGLSRPA